MPPPTKPDTQPARDVQSAAIAATLAQEIVEGSIQAGMHLDEVSLTRRFGVSRTPVREALHALVARSLAQRLPYRGVVVSQMTRARIEEMFEAMAEMEALCGRLAAERMTMGERAAFDAHHTLMGELAETNNVADYEAANTLFHDMIHTGAHNTDLAEASVLLRSKLAPFRTSQLQSLERTRRSHGEHDQIVSAILDHDPAAAERHLRRHLFSAAQEVLLRRGHQDRPAGS